MNRYVSAVLLLFVAAAPAAYAHTELRSSTPAADAVLEHSPGEVVLTFSEPVRMTALSLQSPGAPAAALTVAPAGASERFTAALPALAAGEHVISWRAISADAHIVSGEIPFTVQGGHGDTRGH